MLKPIARGFGSKSALYLIILGFSLPTFADDLRYEYDLVPLTHSEDIEKWRQISENSPEELLLFQLPESDPPYYILIHAPPFAQEGKTTLGEIGDIFGGVSSIFHQFRTVSTSRSSERATWAINDDHLGNFGGYQTFKLQIIQLPESSDESQLILGLTCYQEHHGLKQKKEINLIRLDDRQKRQEILASLWIGEIPRLAYRANRFFRDDWGVYYFVEERQNPSSGERYRLWRGYRGEMKVIPTITAASDSEGIVLVSKEASMRLVSKGRHLRPHTSPTSQITLDGDFHGAVWIEEGVHKPLLEIPIDRNRHIIYGELGIYDHIYLGSPCDPSFGRMPKNLTIGDKD